MFRSWIALAGLLVFGGCLPTSAEPPTETPQPTPSSGRSIAATASESEFAIEPGCELSSICRLCGLPGR